MASQYWRAFATVWILLLGAESSPWPGPDSISRNRISYPPLNSPAPAPISYDHPYISTWTEAYGSPSPSPDLVPVPARAPLETSADVEDDFQSNIDAAATVEEDEEEKEWTTNTNTNTNTTTEVVGMTGGNKAGVVFGVLMGGVLLVLAGFVYKKRRDNIRRSRYGHATWRGLL